MPNIRYFNNRNNSKMFNDDYESSDHSRHEVSALSLSGYSFARSFTWKRKTCAAKPCLKVNCFRQRTHTWRLEPVCVVGWSSPFRKSRTDTEPSSDVLASRVQLVRPCWQMSTGIASRRNTVHKFSSPNGMLKLWRCWALVNGSTWQLSSWATSHHLAKTHRLQWLAKRGILCRAYKEKSCHVYT